MSFPKLLGAFWRMRCLLNIVSGLQSNSASEPSTINFNMPECDLFNIE